MNASDVVQYLRAHPEFFKEHPEAMAQVVWPHDVGDATSLLEFQARRERRNAERLQRKLDDYRETAVANEDRLRRLHDFCVAMVGIQSISGLLDKARNALHEQFDIDFASIAVLDGALAHPRLPLLTGDKARAFEPVLEAGEAVCGRLQDEQLSALMAEKLGEIRSAALIPMGRPAFAILALGSRNEDKFYPGMGTLFLDMLGQMLAQCLLSASRSHLESV